MIESLREITTGFFLIVSAIFFLLTAIGMFRFDHIYARLHAAGKCLTGGTVTALLAYLVSAPSVPIALRVIPAALFLLFTNAIGTHALARAAHSVGVDHDALAEDSYVQSELYRHTIAYGRELRRPPHAAEGDGSEPPAGGPNPGGGSQPKGGEAGPGAGASGAADGGGSEPEGGA